MIDHGEESADYLVRMESQEWYQMMTLNGTLIKSERTKFFMKIRTNSYAQT